MFTNRRTWIMVGILCLTSFVLMLVASFSDAAITDEIAHIPSGYGYVHNLDYRLNPEHPPLVKALAALPLLALDPHFPVTNNAWTTAVNGQWDMGRTFLYASENDANLLLRVVRFGPMLLTLLLIILIFIWSRELLGNAWALLPTLLFALSPTVLAHGHYVTTDIGAAFGVVFATYYFIQFLLEPSGKHLLFAGLAFGVAQIAKFSAVLLIPDFIVLTFVFVFARYIRRRRENRHLAPQEKNWWQYTYSLIAVYAIGFILVVYPLYFLFTINYPQEKQTSDTTTILATFAHGPLAFQNCFNGEPKTARFLKVIPITEGCAPTRALADGAIWMTNGSIAPFGYKIETASLTRPLAQYILGVLMVLQRTDGGNTSYFLGDLSNTGWHYYFPVVYLLKEPLPVLVLVFAALLYGLYGMGAALLKRKTHFFEYLGTNFTEFAMLFFVLFYWLYSIQSTLNIGFRHLFPILPFTYILVAGALKRWINGGTLPEHAHTTKEWLGRVIHTPKKAVLALLLLWFATETIMTTPYYLSYFNELGGGVYGGYRYVTDSNYDWGQDFLRLQAWVNAHPGIDKIAVDYFGGANPDYYLGDKVVPWWSAKGSPTDQNIHWLAVSVNTLEGAQGHLLQSFLRKPEEEYSWLSAAHPPAPGLGNLPPPNFRAGTSIFIYKL